MPVCELEERRTSMAIKPPKSVSLSWWTKNTPKSLPKNKAIEEQLKRIEKTPAEKYEARLDQLQQKAGGDLEKFNSLIADHMPDYNRLLEELKRFKAVVTKQKHDEFIEAIDKLVDLVRKERERGRKNGEKWQKANLSDERETKRFATQVKRFDNDYRKPLVNAQRMVKALSGKVATLDNEDDFSRVIGQSRFLQAAIKTRSKNIKQFAKELENYKGLEGYTELGARTLATEQEFKKVIEAARSLDKAVVRKAMAVLGDEKGKKLFLAAKPVAVSV